jgi:hypothetical protein
MSVSIDKSGEGEGKFYAYLWSSCGAFLYESDNIPRALFDLAKRELARLDRAIHEIECAPLVGTWHLKVKASMNCVVNGVHSKPTCRMISKSFKRSEGDKPVAHDRSLEAPFFSQDVSNDQGIFRNVSAINTIITL